MVGAAEVDCGDPLQTWGLGGCFSPLRSVSGHSLLGAGPGLASGGRFGRA